MANDLVTYFNAVIKSAAEHAGVFYVDVENAMVGHQLCEGPSATMAINGMTFGNDTPIFLPVVSNGSYHPNTLGHQLFADAVLAQTNNLTAPIPTPSANPIPDVKDFDFSNAPVRGYPIRQLYHNPSQNPVLGIKGEYLDVSVSNPDIPLSPFTDYSAELHSDPINLGTVRTNGAGIINARIPLPGNIPAGIHELHIIGTDDDGQAIDIYQLVYVADSANDFDGDGIPNQEEVCGIFEPALIDADQDGIDDGCDPVIGPTPVQEQDNDDPAPTEEDVDTPFTQEPQAVPSVLADQTAKQEFIQNNITGKTLANTGSSGYGGALPLLASCLLIAATILFTLFDRLRYAKR